MWNYTRPNYIRSAWIKYERTHVTIVHCLAIFDGMKWKSGLEEKTRRFREFSTFFKSPEKKSLKLFSFPSNFHFSYFHHEILRIFKVLKISFSSVQLRIGMKFPSFFVRVFRKRFLKPCNDSIDGTEAVKLLRHSWHKMRGTLVLLLKHPYCVSFIIDFHKHPRKSHSLGGSKELWSSSSAVATHGLIFFRSCHGQLEFIGKE